MFLLCMSEHECTNHPRKKSDKRGVFVPQSWAGLRTAPINAYMCIRFSKQLIAPLAVRMLAVAQFPSLECRSLQSHIRNTIVSIHFDKGDN
jgi:hypothetical protein